MTDGPTAPPWGLPLVFDSGPVLCLGGAPHLRAAVIEAWHGHACWVQAVYDEVVRLARGTDHLAVAAKAMTGTRNRWLGKPVTFGPADQADLEVVRGQVRQLDRGNPGPDHHAGEVQSIVHARRNAHGFATNDGPAGRVAKGHRVPPLTAIDLARAVVDVRSGDPVRLYRDLETLENRGIRTGRPWIQGPLDLRPRRKPGTRQRP